MSELITADLHIDSGRDLLETIKVLNFIREEAIKNKVKRVVVLGDIYDKKHPNSEERMVFQKWVMELVDSELEVLLVVGNHDSFALKLEKGKKHYSFGEFEILRTDKVIVVKSGYKENCVYYGHFPIGEAKLGDYDMACFNKNVITAKALLEANPKCNLFILGDIHKGQMVYNANNKRVLYIGSPERITWGERDDRKVILIRDDLKLSSIETPIRKWIQIEEDWTDDNHKLDEPVSDEINGAIVKLVIKVRKDMKFTVREDQIRKRYEQAYKLILVKEVVKTNRVRNKDINESKSPTACFIEYANKLNFSKVTVNEGIRLMEEIKK